MADERDEHLADTRVGSTGDLLVDLRVRAKATQTAGLRGSRKAAMTDSR